MKNARMAIYAAAEALQTHHRQSEEREYRAGGFRPRTPQDPVVVQSKLKELIAEAKAYPAMIKLLEKIRMPVLLSPYGADRWIGVKFEYCNLTMFCGGYTVLSSSREISVEDAAQQLANSGVDEIELEQIWNDRINQFVNASVI